MTGGQTLNDSATHGSGAGPKRVISMSVAILSALALFTGLLKYFLFYNKFTSSPPGW